MQGKKPKKTFTLSYEAIEMLKRLSAGNESYLIETLIKKQAAAQGIALPEMAGVK